MCNPPFYASTGELLSSAMAKSRPSHSACTGADVEMVTPGGEVAFVSRMIEESKILKNRCQWYTSMLGKYSSVEIIVERLRVVGIENWAVNDLVQGNKTRRWAVAWSWGTMRPKQVCHTLKLHFNRANEVGKEVARGTSTLLKHLLPFPSEATLSVPHGDMKSCTTTLNHTLRALDLKWQYKPALATGIGFAKRNVWSRAARRKMGKSPTGPGHPDSSEIHEDDTTDGDEPALGFKVDLNGSVVGHIEVAVRWLQGRDSVLFESFCGMLKRQLTAS